MEIQKIAAKKTIKADGAPVKKRRVAAYARVSTDQEEQQSSYKTQVAYYKKYINARADWEFVKVYADEGITGLNTKRRSNFNKMIRDAMRGKIDLILTKSISRFARNTVDSLTAIRKLKEHGVEICFEKENIWTFDAKGELLITIMSSLAQEESRSISENVTWAIRKRMESGEISFAFNNVYGYDHDAKGKVIINPKTVKVVERIFGLFLIGKSYTEIANILTFSNVPTPKNRKKWNPVTIKSILKNEKYKGEAILQKTWTEDFLTKKKRKNRGELPQYYIKNSHPAIISAKDFEVAQERIAMINLQKNYHHSGHPLLGGKVYCGECGYSYGPKKWDKKGHYVWKCNGKCRGVCKHKMPILKQEDLEGFLSKITEEKHEFRRVVVFRKYLSIELNDGTVEKISINKK